MTAVNDYYKDLVRKSKDAMVVAITDALIARYEEVTGHKATTRLYEKILEAVEYP